MTTQISANSSCAWVSVPMRRVFKFLGLCNPSFFFFFPKMANRSPLYGVHTALHIDYKSDAMVSRWYWITLDLNIYPKPKYDIPLPSDVVPIKTEYNNTETSTVKSGRTTNKESYFLSSNAAFRFCGWIIPWKREISDKEDWKSWGGGECIVSSYSTLMQQQQKKIAQMIKCWDIINNLSSSLVVHRVYIIGRLKPFFVVSSLFISTVEDYKIVQPEGV